MVLWLNIYLRYARYAHYDPYFSYVRLGLVGMDCDGFSYCNNAIWCVLYGFLSWRVVSVLSTMGECILF